MASKLIFHRLPSNPHRAPAERVAFARWSEQEGIELMATMSWYQYTAGPPDPRLEAFPDGWILLASVPELMQALARRARGELLQPDAFCTLLKMLGFEDWSDRPQVWAA